MKIQLALRGFEFHGQLAKAEYAHIPQSGLSAVETFCALAREIFLE